jgi:hypothetical protein
MFTMSFDLSRPRQVRSRLYDAYRHSSHCPEASNSASTTVTTNSEARTDIDQQLSKKNEAEKIDFNFSANSLRCFQIGWFIKHIKPKRRLAVWK